MSDLPNTPETRREQFLNAIATSNTSGLPEPVTREEVYLNYIAENGGGSGTTTNYNELANKPKINNVELLGNISLNDLNIYNKNTIDNAFVAKETGKSLSSNDYSDSEKTKVSTAESINASQDALLIDNASKNILEITADNFTRNGITFTINRNEDNQVTSITANGTATSSVFFEISNVLDLEDNVEYILSGCPTGGKQNNTYILYISFESINVMDSGDGVVFKKSSDVEAVRIAIYNGYTANNLTFYPMVRRAEITDDTFEPYYRTQKQLDADLSAIEAKQETQNQKISEIGAYIGYTENDIYGVEADFENSIFTRLAGAVGKSAGSDFNSVNAFGGRRRCNLADDGTVNAYYGDIGYKEDGSNGQVMVEQPKFYYKMVPLKLDKQTGNGKGYHIRKARYYISDTPKSGFKVHPAFVNASGNVVDYVYIGAYEGSLYDVSEGAYITNDAQVADFANDKFCSISSVKPASGLTQDLTRPNIEAMCQNRGAEWHEENAQIVSMTQLLMLVEYGQFDFQRALGKGVVDITDNSSYNCSATTGSTAALGNTSGSATSTDVTIGEETTAYIVDGKVSISYRGQENVCGNIWKFVMGVNIYGDGNMNGGEPCICLDYNYDENKNTDNYRGAGFTLPNNNNYISALGYGNTDFDWLLMPSEATGSSNALPVGDYEYITANLTGFRIALLGGYWHSAWDAGGFFWACINGVGLRSRYIGGRLVFIPSS